MQKFSDMFQRENEDEWPIIFIDGVAEDVSAKL